MLTVVKFVAHVEMRLHSLLVLLDGGGQDIRLSRGRERDTHVQLRNAFLLKETAGSKNVRSPRTRRRRPCLGFTELSNGAFDCPGQIAR